MRRSGPPQHVAGVLAQARQVAKRERPAELSAQAAGSQDRREPLSPAGAPPVARCKSCGAPVYWCETATGAAMPVDVDPVENGNVQLHWNGRRILAVYLTGDVTKVPGPRRVSHFASCPVSKMWRKR